MWRKHAKQRIRHTRRCEAQLLYFNKYCRFHTAPHHQPQLPVQGSGLTGFLQEVHDDDTSVHVCLTPGEHSHSGGSDVHNAALMGSHRRSVVRPGLHPGNLLTHRKREERGRGSFVCPAAGETWSDNMAASRRETCRYVGIKLSC